MNLLDLNKTPILSEDGEFKALKTLSSIFYAIGWVGVVVGVACVFILFDTQAFFAVLIGFGIVFLGLMSFAFSEIIGLFLKIEKNTRKN